MKTYEEARKALFDEFIAAKKKLLAEEEEYYKTHHLTRDGPYTVKHRDLNISYRNKQLALKEKYNIK